MEHPIRGLHHVTATVDDAQQDLDFCREVLGLRLVKKTVNFDNHHVYHFYYGDERGTPGTIWTTFPYKGRGVRIGQKGAGQVTTTAFSVPAASLPYWRTRLAERAIVARDVTGRFGEDAIAVTDPSGLDFELIGTTRDDRTAWTGSGIGDESAIRGLHSVGITVRSPQATVDLMTDLLGYHVIDEIGGRIRVGIQDQPGRTIDIVHSLEAEPAINGLGTVHHVAMAISTEDEQRRLREELLRYGCKVTEVRDRCYFQSIYFREPGAVLFEVATVQPGFTIDEAVDDLGRGLKLPPWEEPHRAEIEEGLPDISTRSAR
jgi:glyoxalase family protein